jgi:hypothetical protein
VFLVVRKLVMRRLDLCKEPVSVSLSDQVRPAGVIRPVGVDQVSQDSFDGFRGKNFKESFRGRNVFAGLRPEVSPETLGFLEALIKEGL